MIIFSVSYRQITINLLCLLFYFYSGESIYFEKIKRSLLLNASNIFLTLLLLKNVTMQFIDKIDTSKMERNND